jgi:hypothetical protein
MSKDFELTTFRTEGVKELAKFLGKEYPSGEISNEKYLSWEYLDNPSGKAIVTTARNSDKEIVSQYALLPSQVFADGKVIPATLSLNTLTSKGYRGKGLFTSTANESFNYCRDTLVAFTFGVPNKNSFPGFVSKLGFRHVGDLAFMAKALKPVSVLKSLINRKDEKKGAAISISFNRKKLGDNSVSEFKLPEDEKLYRNFLESWNALGNISVQRSQLFLQWRYMLNPTRNYELLKLVSDGEIKSLVVIRAMHLYGMRVCVVMDMMSLDEKYSRVLLSLISSEAKNNELELMIAVVAHRECRQSNQFLRSGFWNIPKIFLPQQLPFILRIHNKFDRQTRMLDLKNWHFSFGDYDVF